MFLCECLITALLSLGAIAQIVQPPEGQGCADAPDLAYALHNQTLHIVRFIDGQIWDAVIYLPNFPHTYIKPLTFCWWQHEALFATQRLRVLYIPRDLLT